MGTHSTIKFYNEYDIPLVCIYQQWDGYISGVGYDLANFLKSKKIINGIAEDTTMEDGYANGMECLVAQYIRENKTCIGSLYIQPIDSITEYDYEVRYVDDEFVIKVHNFEGTPEELLNYKEK